MLDEPDPNSTDEVVEFHLPSQLAQALTGLDTMRRGPIETHDTRKGWRYGESTGPAGNRAKAGPHDPGCPLKFRATSDRNSSSSVSKFRRAPSTLAASLERPPNSMA